MGFFVVVVRLPIGLAAAAVLLVWTLLVLTVYALFFVFLSIFGKLAQINERLNPWLDAFNGVKCLPGLWGWVFRPYQGIFEEVKTPEVPAGGAPEGDSLLDRYKKAAAKEPAEAGKSPDSPEKTSSSHVS